LYFFHLKYIVMENLKFSELQLCDEEKISMKFQINFEIYENLIIKLGDTKFDFWYPSFKFFHPWNATISIPNKKLLIKLKCYLISFALCKRAAPCWIEIFAVKTPFSLNFGRDGCMYGLIQGVCGLTFIKVL